MVRLINKINQVPFKQSSRHIAAHVLSLERNAQGDILHEPQAQVELLIIFVVIDLAWWWGNWGTNLRVLPSPITTDSGLQGPSPKYTLKREKKHKLATIQCYSFWFPSPPPKKKQLAFQKEHCCPCRSKPFHIQFPMLTSMAQHVCHGRRSVSLRVVPSGSPLQNRVPRHILEGELASNLSEDLEVRNFLGRAVNGSQWVVLIQLHKSLIRLNKAYKCSGAGWFSWLIDGWVVAMDWSKKNKQNKF